MFITCLNDEVTGLRGERLPRIAQGAMGTLPEPGRREYADQAGAMPGVCSLAHSATLSRSYN